MLAGFGRYLVVAASQKDCGLAKTDSSLRLEGTDWSMCISSSITTSGGGILTHRLRPALPISSLLPREWKVVLSSRQMEVRLPSNLPAAALMKSGCAGATEVTSCS